MMSRDGTLVGRGTVDGAIQLWETGKAASVPPSRGTTAGITPSPWFRNGVLASGGYDGTVRLWDAESGQSLPPFEGHAAGVSTWR